MKTLKKQIAAINSALRTYQNFEMDEGMPSDGLRDAATTLIALEAIVRRKDSFLFDFATKLIKTFHGNATDVQFMSPRQARDVASVLEGYLVETGLLPPIDRPRDNSDCINDAVKYSIYGLRCFNCNGTGYNTTKIFRAAIDPYRLEETRRLKNPRPIKRCVYCGRTNYRHVDKSCPGYGNPDKAYRDLPYRTWSALPSESTPEKFKRKRHGKNRN